MRSRSPFAICIHRRPCNGNVWRPRIA